MKLSERLWVFADQGAGWLYQRSRRERRHQLY